MTIITYHYTYHVLIISATSASSLLYNHRITPIGIHLTNQHYCNMGYFTNTTTQALFVGHVTLVQNLQDVSVTHLMFTVT